MARLFSSTLGLFVLISAVSANNCYFGVKKQVGNEKPTGSVTQGSNCLYGYCIKQVSVSRDYTTFSYGCGDYTCQKNGFIDMGNGFKQCCCSTDLCNSRSSLTVVFSVLISVFLAFWL